MKMNKKGFTIVELVIVIAVIAILAAVLIPTFSGVIQKANDSAALQQATSAMKSALAQSTSATLVSGTTFVIGDASGVKYAFEFENDKLGTDNVKDKTDLFTKEYGDQPFNTIIVPVANGNASAEAKTMALVKAITGGTANNYDSTISTSAVSGAVKSYTVSTGDDTVVWSIITNADFAEGLVVYTFSN